MSRQLLFLFMSSCCSVYHKSEMWISYKIHKNYHYFIIYIYMCVLSTGNVWSVTRYAWCGQYLLCVAETARWTMPATCGTAQSPSCPEPTSSGTSTPTWKRCWRTSQVRQRMGPASYLLWHILCVSSVQFAPRDQSRSQNRKRCPFSHIFVDQDSK